jgi:hypothetical protein
MAMSSAALALLAAAPGASANVTTTVTDFNLTTSTSTYSSYLATTSSGVLYRWSDYPSKVTYISAASCYNNAPFGQSAYPAGYIGYLWIGTVASGSCFNLRGRTASGSMFYYDGQVSR